MGAAEFTAVSDNDDVSRAFAELTTEARHEHGHGGYTGTIAEKDTYRVFRIQPHTLEEADQIAYDYLERDTGKFCDKYGPAGAIKLHKGWLFFGVAAS